MINSTIYSLSDIKIKIKKMIDTCHINVLLGAGFSSIAFPNMEELKEIFLFLLNNFNSNISKLSSSSFPKSILKFLSNNNVSKESTVVDLINIFKQYLVESNIPEIISLFDSENFEDVLYQSNIKNIFKMNGNNNKNLSNCFIELFHKIYFIVKDKEEYNKNIERINELVCWLMEKQDYHSKKSMKETINIFTTNYDTLIEESLEKLGIYYYNGFNGIIKRKFYPDNYNYSYVDDMNLNKNFFQVKKSVFNLIKLHGSITWKLEVNNNSYELKEIGIKNQPILNDSNIYPHIIYPSTDKLHMSLNYDHYYKLQGTFKDSLYKRDSCLFIFGFSMKDNHLWKIIDSALSTGNLSIFIFTSENILSNLDENNKNKKLDNEKIANSFRKELLDRPGVNFVCCPNYNFSEIFSEISLNESKEPHIILQSEDLSLNEKENF